MCVGIAKYDFTLLLQCILRAIVCFLLDFEDSWPTSHIRTSNIIHLFCDIIEADTTYEEPTCEYDKAPRSAVIYIATKVCYYILSAGL